MSWTLDGRPLARILVTRLRYLGDVVMATVVADVLKAGDPRLEVGFLCEAGHAPVLAGHSALDRVHALASRRRGADARARVPGPAAGFAEQGWAGTVAQLRRAHYDLAVDLFFNPRSAWLLRLGGVGQRIGGATGFRRRLYTHTVTRGSVADDTGVLDRVAGGGLGDHLCRLAPLVHGPTGQPFLSWLDAGAGGRVRPRLPRRQPTAATLAALTGDGFDPGGGYLVAAPAATWPTKEWPVAAWRRLLEDLPTRCGLPVAVLVPPGRPDIWSEAGRGWPRGVSVLPPRDLPAVLDVLGGARGVVTVDGGIMHAAVGMGVPTVALFGPTDPRIWFPYLGTGPFRVLATRPTCHPCDRHRCDEFICLPDLAPDAVFDALEAVLDESPSGGGL